jgi:hypothetical protein
MVDHYPAAVEPDAADPMSFEDDVPLSSISSFQVGS